MKVVLFVLMTAMLTCGVASADTAIYTCSDLQNMSDNLTENYYLANDINCTGFDCGDGKGFMPIGDRTVRFSGTFDGRKHKITDLYINRTSTEYTGLFGNTDDGSEIRDVGLVNVSVAGAGRGVGGLTGDNEGHIVNCYTTGDVILRGNTMGGGLSGWTHGTEQSIRNCYSKANVTKAEGVTDIMGAGGLVGGHSWREIDRSYSMGNVIDGETGQDIGGLMGFLCDQDAWCTESYWDVNTSKQPTSLCGEGKTTPEMKQQATFVNWDFDNEWIIMEEGATYPALQWEYKIPGIYDDITCIILPSSAAYSKQSTSGHSLQNLTISPTSALTINVTTLTEPLKRWNESADASAYALYTVGEGDANTTYVVSVYADANGSRMQTFRIKANSTGYIKYNTTGYGYDRWTEIIPAAEPPGQLVTISVIGAVLLGGGWAIRRWVKKN